MKKFVLMFVLLATAAVAQTPVDAILTLRPESGAVAPGTQVNPAILNAGTFGPITWSFASGTASTITVGPNQAACADGASLSIGGKIYPPETPAQSFAYNLNTNSTTYFGDLPTLSTNRAVSANFCLVSNAAPNNLWDIFGLYDVQGHYAMFQQRNSNQLNIETDGAGTIHSPAITITMPIALNCDLNVNETTGIAKAACYQPQFPYAQLSCTPLTTPTLGNNFQGCDSSGTIQIAANTGRSPSRIRMGNNEIGTANTTSYLQNIKMDYTTAAFPMAVRTQYALWAGIIAPTRATKWAGVGVVGGIPARTTICSTLSPGVTAAQIVSALNACPAGQTVFLNAGTYNVAGINIPKSSVTLRGAGGDQTFLVATSNIGSPCSVNGTFICISASDNNFKSSPSNLTNWTTGYLEGSSVITLAAVPNLKVGNILMVDQLDDTCDAGGIIVSTATTPCTPTAPGISGPYSLEDNGGGNQRSGRSQLQVLTVKGCGSVTTVGALCTGTNVAVTIDPPLRMPNWRASQTPQAWWATNPIHDVGIENMSIDGTAILGTGIQIKNGYNNWVKGTRIIDTDRAHVQDSYASHNTVRDNYMFLSQKGGQQSYGFECFVGADDLIENNIFHAITGPVLMNGACMGEVVSYNYAINMWYTVSAGWDDPMSSVHTAGVSQVLYEGNVSNGVESDVFHGTHYFVSEFRNRFSGTQAATFGGPNQPDGSRTDNLFPTATYIPANNNQYVYRTESFSRGYNFLANVMGTTGITNAYQNTKPGIFEVGIGNNNSTTTVASDPNTGSSMMRYGNLDNVHGYTSPQFVPSEIPTAPPAPQVPFANFTPNLGNTGAGQIPFPASFVYSTTPSWWPSAKAWPPIGPDVTGGNIANVGGHAFTIPAQDCATLIGINTNGTNGAQSFNAAACFAASAGPALVISPSSNNYGNVNVGSFGASVTVNLTNTGTSVLTITGNSLTGNDPTQFSRQNLCGSSLNPGISCQEQVNFVPTSTGAKSANLTITSDANNGTQSYVMTGTGVSAAPVAQLSSSTMAFGSKQIGTQTPIQTVVLTNTGTSTLNISSVVLSGTNASDFNLNNLCGATLTAGSNCLIQASFTPQTLGSKTASITITDNASDSPQAISLTGTGIQSSASFNPISLSFPSQTLGSSSSPTPVVLSNSGTAALTVISIVASGDFSQTNNCPTSSQIAVGGSCTINVTFTPTASGLRNGAVTVTSNGAGSPQTVPLSGLGQGTTPCGMSISGNGILISGGVSFSCPASSQFVFQDLNPFASNGSGCSALGSPAYCTKAFTPLSTDPANTNAQTQLVIPAPANYSTVDLHTYLYSGNTTRVLMHWQPWFCSTGTTCNSHLNIGYNENSATVVTAQLTAMKALGVDVVVPDYYGNHSSKAFNLASVNALANAIASSTSGFPKMMLTIDQGAWTNSGQCPAGAGITTANIETCIEDQLDYAAQTYLYQSYYETEGGKPIVAFFLDETNWPSVDFDAAYTHIHAHVAAGQSCGGACTYTTAVLLLGRNSGAITQTGLDGSFAWSPTQHYVNASPGTQLQWNGTSGYLDNFYSIARANASKVVIGLLERGFDDSNASFGTGKIIAQQCGQVLKFSGDKVLASGYSTSSQLKRIQLQTWNDMEEATGIENGIDNCVSISASVVGTSMSYTVTPSDATYFSLNTIDHFRVLYGTGTSYQVGIDNISPALSGTINLTPIPTGKWVLLLQAVGRSAILNHLSGPMIYIAS